MEGAGLGGGPGRTWRRLYEETVRCVDWAGRMLWIVMDGEADGG